MKFLFPSAPQSGRSPAPESSQEGELSVDIPIGTQCKLKKVQEKNSKGEIVAVTRPMVQTVKIIKEVKFGSSSQFDPIAPSVPGETVTITRIERITREGDVWVLKTKNDSIYHLTADNVYPVSEKRQRAPAPESLFPSLIYSKEGEFVQFGDPNKEASVYQLGSPSDASVVALGKETSVVCGADEKHEISGDLLRDFALKIRDGIGPYTVNVSQEFAKASVFVGKKPVSVLVERSSGRFDLYQTVNGPAVYVYDLQTKTVRVSFANKKKEKILPEGVIATDDPHLIKHAVTLSDSEVIIIASDFISHNGSVDAHAFFQKKITALKEDLDLHKGDVQKERKIRHGLQKTQIELSLFESYTEAKDKKKWLAEVLDGRDKGLADVFRMCGMHGMINEFVEFLQRVEPKTPLDKLEVAIKRRVVDRSEAKDVFKNFCEYFDIDVHDFTFVMLNPHKTSLTGNIKH